MANPQSQFLSVKCLSVLLVAGALTFGMSGKVVGEQIFTKIRDTGLNQPSVRIDHRAGATEGYGAYDSRFLAVPSSGIDFFSEVVFDPYRLKNDARPLDSFSTISEKLYGRELSTSVSGNILFTRYDLYNDNAFANKSIFADLYNSSDTLLGTYNVKELAATGTTIPVTVNNGLSYTLDIRFERPGDANRDGVVDAADYIALKQNFGMSPGATWKQGDFTGDGTVDWSDLQMLMNNFGAGLGGISAQTPEPATVLLFSALGLPLIGRRKKRTPQGPARAGLSGPG